MTDPAVSVVMACRNGARTIAAALQSIPRDSDGLIEIIVIDDGSTDDSAEVVEAEFRSEVVLHRQQAIGLSRARNVGLAMARAPVVAFLDADDTWMPGTTRAHLTALEDDDVGVVFGDCLLVNEETALTVQLSFHIPQPDEPRLIDLLRWRPVPSSTVAARRALLLGHGGFDERLESCQDYDLWYRLLLGGVRFRRIGSVLASIQVRRGALSSDLDRYRRDMRWVFERILADRRLSPVERHVVLDQRRRLAEVGFPAHEPDRAHPSSEDEKAGEVP